MSLSVDTADPQQVEQAAGEVERRFGPIDIWVNVAFTSVSRRSTRSARRIQAGHRGQPTSATSTPRWRRCGACGRATGAPSSRSARRWPIAVSRYSRPIAAPSTPSRASTSRCAPSCCTSAATCTSRWCRCRRSTRRNSPGCCPGCPTSTTGAADLSARGGGRRRRVRRRSPQTPRVLGRRHDDGHPDRRQDRPRPAGPLSVLTGYKSQQTDQPRTAGPTGELVGRRRRHRRPRFRRPRHVRRQVHRSQLQLWASHHHGLLGGIAGAVAAAAGITGLAMRR